MTPERQNAPPVSQRRRRRVALLGAATAALALIAAAVLVTLDSTDVTRTDNSDREERAEEVAVVRTDPTGFVFLRRDVVFDLGNPENWSSIQENLGKPGWENWNNTLVDTSLAGEPRSQMVWPEEWEDPIEQTPVMSPDGRTLYFDSFAGELACGWEGEEETSDCLDPATTYIVGFDMATGATEIVVENGFHPALSPDGRWLAYARINPEDEDSEDELAAPLQFVDGAPAYARVGTEDELAAPQKTAGPLRTLVVRDLETGAEVSREVVPRAPENYSLIEQISWSDSSELAISFEEQDTSGTMARMLRDVVRFSWNGDSLSEVASFPIPEGVAWQGYMGTSSFVGVCWCEHEHGAVDIVRLDGTTGEVEETLFTVEGTIGNPEEGSFFRVEADRSGERLLIAMRNDMGPVSFFETTVYVWTREDPDPEPLVEAVRMAFATWSYVL